MLKSSLKISIYISILLIPFYFFRFSIAGIRTNVFEISVLISFVLAITQTEFNLKLNKKSHWLVTGLFLLVVLIAAMLSENRISALGIFKGWFLVPVIFAWVVSKSIKADKVWEIGIPLISSLLIISIWAVLQEIGIISTMFYQTGDASFDQYISQGRSFGPFESPNFLAMYIVPVLFLVLILFEKIKDKQKKVILFLSCMLPAMALYYASSRAGLIAFIVGLAVYFNYRFINLQKSKSRRPFYAGLFVLIFLTVNLLYLSYASHIAVPIKNSDMLRIEIYKKALTLLKENYFLGIGSGTFQDKVTLLFDSSNPIIGSGLSYALHPHNLFLAIWLNLGLAGLIIFLWLLISFFKNAFSIDSPVRAALLASMTAILIHGLFDTTYFKNDLSAIFWLVFAITLIPKE